MDWAGIFVNNAKVRMGSEMKTHISFQEKLAHRSFYTIAVY